MKVLVLGSKEYPMGTNQGDDPQPSGGIEIYIDKLLEKLSENRPLRFIVITRLFKGAKAFEKKDGIEVHRVKWFKGFYFRNISFNLMSFLRALSLDFDVIFSQDVFATFFAAFLSKIKRRSLVGVVHGVASNQPQYPWFVQKTLERFETFSYNRTDHLISLSDSPKKVFETKLNKNTRWSVIPLGIDIEAFTKLDRKAAKAELDIPEDTVVITFIGRLLKVKGTIYLIKALASIREDFLALIVGSGPEEDKLKKAVLDCDLGNKIRFLGFRQDVPKILVASEIYVLPSVSEGLSLSLLEAKAAGCACIVSDIGLPVENMVNALVVKPEDPAALTKAVETLLRDKKLRKTLSVNAKNDAVKNYDWENIIRKYQELFETTLEKTR